MASTFEPPIQYLRECSDNSLRHFEVVKLEHVANLRRELRVLWDEMLEESSLALLARWMLEHRSYLRSRVHSVEPPLAVLGGPPALTTTPGDFGQLQRESDSATLSTAATACGAVLNDPGERPAPARGRDFSSAVGEPRPDASSISRTLPPRGNSRGAAQHDREGSCPARPDPPC
jgi:hypothetical protein